jgi:hypothetical protein
MVTGRAAACDDFETFLVQTLANGGTDATHATGYVRDFLTHSHSPRLIYSLQKQ